MENFHKHETLRNIPPINDLLELSVVKELIDKHGKNPVLDKIRLIIEEFRNNVQIMSRAEITQYILEKLLVEVTEYEAMGLRKVINATGIVLHTNLGRAPLPQNAIKYINEVCEGYCNLEFDIESGKRGSRYSHIEPLIKKITGAESALVVNNNAAAVFLALNTLANNREVVISRGQQVEIGGSFRIPDIIARSSAKMVEIGTTNKTRISDYANAIREDTSVLLKVHTSNYKVIGFTEEVPLEELVSLSKEQDLVVMEDLGSGSLLDLSTIGLPYERTVQDSLKAGADIITFSGDKLLGGPQVGVIVGKKELIDKIKLNPLTRMLRCDKLTIASLTAVLNLYMDSEKAFKAIPVLRMMALKEEELIYKASELEKLINKELKSIIETEIVDDLDEVGGGSLPAVILKGKAVALKVINGDINEFQESLRKSHIPIICKIKKDRVIINVRTIENEDFKLIVETLKGILGEKV
ncbi:L-seryl-tRNA(Sec) selenium transferase [Clostridium homopropionicum DSM 5847]|uniref:L-seryl-tRNA(Sec) selenium transferase n=1 Tax=Clostridium homopropionicum DSM 5847 TaxID=1121318 RepID=A0A0L6ZAZ2_9CLOT|nr:L-seryl-tRNA(Sec) selenium transferase [Clostridium homopropionicum]KOA20141.1 L-seryl-tRNA(Sec) selenium transferase [Clostridium homopropionicum DSM 5847]SFG61545.1 L-seryl-tRNA(Sec) selenium transferase [Clostridium homopropionicum]